MRTAPLLLSFFYHASALDSQTFTTSSSPLERTTRAFEAARQSRGGGGIRWPESMVEEKDWIDVDGLLDACYVFLGVLEQTGPKAVERDFANNLRKAAALVSRATLDSSQRPANKNRFGFSVGGRETRSRMGLATVLRYERDHLGVHHKERKGGDDGYQCLAEGSGAMGLLWIRRSLEFQCGLYSGLIGGYEPREAALKAYRDTLRPYHGQVLRRFYTIFLSTKMPSRHDMLAHLANNDDDVIVLSANEQDKIVLEELRRLTEVWYPLLGEWKMTFKNLGLDDESHA